MSIVLFTAPSAYSAIATFQNDFFSNNLPPDESEPCDLEWPYNIDPESQEFCKQQLYCDETGGHWVNNECIYCEPGEKWINNECVSDGVSKKELPPSEIADDKRPCLKVAGCSSKVEDKPCVGINCGTKINPEVINPNIIMTCPGCDELDPDKINPPEPPIQIKSDKVDKTS